MSDIDWTALDTDERWTLEHVIPKIEEGFTVKEIAAELALDAQQLQASVDRLAAKVMALSGVIELPPLSDDEREALKSSLTEHGQQHPILRGSPTSGLPGEIIDGHTRRSLLAQLGLEPWYRDVDGSADELCALALVLNLARRHMSTSARRGIVKAKLLANPTLSDRAIASAIGVSPTTVGTVRRELEQAGKVSKLDTRTGRDGVQQPAVRPEKAAQPPASHRSIRVQVAAEMFEQWVGDWVSCRAFRLVERRAGVYELEVRILDPVEASVGQREAVLEAIADLAVLGGRPLDDVERELLAVTSDVFARQIGAVDELSTDEAEWLLSRAGGILEPEPAT